MAAAPLKKKTDGVASAIDVAHGIAGERNVGVAAGSLTSQCLELGLLDEIWFDLVPVVLGGGTPFFSPFSRGPVLLDGPTIIEGAYVTHLRYEVRRPDRSS